MYIRTMMWIGTSYQPKHSLWKTSSAYLVTRLSAQDSMPSLVMCVSGGNIEIATQLDIDYLQCHDFLVADIKEHGQRHLLFATQYQLDLLRQARRWFMDGTFKVVKEPFKQYGQLLSIHAFIVKDGQRKQLPLIFILMSRKRQEDYFAVLQTLKDKIDPVVEHFVVDFEQAEWLAIRQVFPGATIKGCYFHWNQAVWRKVQNVGLVTSYQEHEAVYHYIRQLMAVPFLPAGQLVETFNNLKTRANTQPLQQLVTYMQTQWFDNTIIHPEDWCVFRRSIRTNNDVEGWHNRLNTQAGQAGVPIYVLVPELRTEAEIVNVSVAADDLERETHRKYTLLETRIQAAWDQYTNKEIPTSRFLKIVAKLYGPPDNMPEPPHQQQQQQ